MLNSRNFLVLFLLLGSLNINVWAGVDEQIYLSQQDFLSQNLGADFESKVIWFDEALRAQLTTQLKYLPSSPRLRYWQAENKRAWIVEEIGRDKPITLGFIVQNNTITKFEVLVFRESRGYEIRYPAFAQQLNHMGLEMAGEQLKLNQPVDNITGATLSVNAVKKMARFVLYLDAHLSGA